jgi:hypothetical protein
LKPDYSPFGILRMLRNSKIKTLISQLYIVALTFVAIACVSKTVYAIGLCGTPSFTKGKTFEVGNTLRSVVKGDFNGDGKPDIAVASLESNFISVLLGDGAGGFGAAKNITVGIRPVAIEAADFNGDNKLDFAVSVLASASNPHDPHTVILLGDGAGGFTVTSSFNAGGLIESIAVADFNSDGKVDLALADEYNSGRILLKLGDGTGNFSGSDSFILGTNPDRIITRDFNGDGRPDVATTNSFGNSILISLNNGAGGFASAVTYPTGSGPLGIAAEDFNGDGKLDLVVSNMISSDVAIILGNGSGGFGAPTKFFTGKQLTNITTGDFNSDGKADVAVTSPAKDVTVILGDGLGGFGAAASFAIAEDPTSIVAGDFNQDSKLDLITSRGGSPGVLVTLLNSCEAGSTPQPEISINDVTRPEGNTSFSNLATFTVTLSSPSAQRVTMSYASAGGTATPYADFTPVSGTLVFEPGETTKTILVSIEGDSGDEYDETFTINLSNPIGGTIVRGQGTCTLTNDDPPPTVSIRDMPPSYEGDTGLSTINVGMFLSIPSPKPITVSYTTADGTAAAKSDYQAASGSVTFAPGETTKTLEFRIIGDTVNEATETFFVNLSNPINVTIEKAQGIVTILNDDIPTVQLAQRTYSVSEEAGNFIIPVIRTGDPSIPVTVDYSTTDAAGTSPCTTVNGRASSLCDYTPRSGTLQFAAGETVKAISIPLVDDGLIEGTEKFAFSLTNPTGGANLGSNTLAQISITDNESTGVPAPLELILDETGPGAGQAAAIDSLLALRDPFPVISAANLLNLGTDRNTRVIVFVTNLQLAQGEAPSSVFVNLIDSNSQGYDIAAEYVGTISYYNLTQVVFRLPDNLSFGTCTIKVKAHGLESNWGTIRIKN